MRSGLCRLGTAEPGVGGGAGRRWAGPEEVGGAGSGWAGSGPSGPLALTPGNEEFEFYSECGGSLEGFREGQVLILFTL